MKVNLYYLILIASATTALIGMSIRQLKRLQREREKRLNRQDHPESIPADTARKAIRNQQIERVQSRFSITRWAMGITILLTGMGLAAIPYLKQISPTLLPILMGVVSVITGIAAKPFIENMICGLVLCHSKLARIGDVTLVDEAYGVIEDVTLTHCIVKRWDSLRYVVPNSSMMTKEFVNYSLNDNERWVIVEFWIDYSANIEEVEELAIQTPHESHFHAKKEPPRFWVVETDRAGVKCMVTAWATSPAEGWMLGHDIRKALLKNLQAHQVRTHSHHIKFHTAEAPPAMTVSGGAS